MGTPNSDFILFSMRWTGVHLQSRKDVGRHTQPSGTGTRAFLRDGRASLCALVSYLDRLCSPLLPAARPGPAARSPAPCRRALYHLPQPMLMSISICAMRRRGLVALPVLLVVALPLPPAAHVRQGSMRGMQGRHGGGRRGGREAARRRGLARVHTGGRERPKSDEHTQGSLGRESAPGTRACVRSLISTSPCDGDTTVSARVQTAVSTPCGGSTQGQRVRGHNRRAARRAQSALGLSYTPAFPAHAQAPPPHPLPGVRQVSRRQQRPRQRPHHGGAATAPAIARPSIPLTPCPPLRLTP